MPDAIQISELLAKAQQGFTFTSAIVVVLTAAFLLEADTLFSVTGRIMGVFLKNTEWYDLENKREFFQPRNIIAFICTFAVSFFAIRLGFCRGGFAATHPEHVTFFCIWGIIFGYFLLRAIVFAIISWITNNNEIIKYLFNSVLSYFILFALVLFLVLILSFAIPSFPEKLSFNISIAALVFFNLCCDIKAFRKLNSDGFSSFFGFLYLCILEILPTAAFAKAVITF
ncbi:MAG: DUF4271 domain-containing protein [Bacteroidales bacterium]|jgi:hypothetical protein|nr:DUF4271 domain-containing protein [Bacteroidales bacterium]MCI2121174.1 DUF4271 domain-containing protein [Bacteroidales bacterium]MCI2145038.1 DUF4271 domain-containing protein [Bacteroidales bacterium]